RRLLPLRRRPPGAARRGREGDRAARWFGARRRGHRRGTRGRRDDVLHGGAPLLPLTYARPATYQAPVAVSPASGASGGGRRWFRPVVSRAFGGGTRSRSAE